jgi:hypothetical protein
MKNETQWVTDEDVDNMIRKRVARKQVQALKEWEELQPLRDRLNQIKKEVAQQKR